MPLPKPTRPSFAFCLTAAAGKSMTPKIPVHSEAFSCLCGFFFLSLQFLFLSLRAQRSNPMIIRKQKRLLRRASSQ
jgi:hypothetical protein